MPSSTPVKLCGRHHERPPSVSSLPHPHKGRLLLACCPTKPPDLGAGNPWPDTRASGFHDEDLAVLQEQFVAGPRTYGWAGGFGGPGLTIYRFQRPGQRVWVATHPEQTEW